MSEAGVAGCPLAGMLGGRPLANIAGECFAESGLGGGRISPSERGSGEIESEELGYALDSLALTGDVGESLV